MSVRKKSGAGIFASVTAVIAVLGVLALVIWQSTPVNGGPDGHGKAYRRVELQSPEEIIRKHEQAQKSRHAKAVYSCEFGHWAGLQLKDVHNELVSMGRFYRILRPDSIATTDHNPERINIHTDDNGVITAVRCG